MVIYTTDDGQAKVQVRVEEETVWLTQKQMAELFDKDVRTVNEHIKNIFDEGELNADSVIRKFRITAAGRRYFEELLQRIRDIRSSERNFYQKVTDIYATTIDYRKADENGVLDYIAQ